MAISRLSSDIVGKADAYKYSHWLQYPPGTKFVESYLEMRIGAKFRKVVPFGLQYYLMEYLEGIRVTRESIDKMQRRIHKQMGSSEIFNLQGWLRLLKNTRVFCLSASVHFRKVWSLTLLTRCWSFATRRRISMDDQLR
jgi:hypothetical protein